ncbi:MAG: 4Fe-4S dicluster domain-containing protein, partial [Polyangiaceae bacterium]|nr:4Fe-4S dicluster domain-containing protein [Polyangiaceae bacterium]
MAGMDEMRAAAISRRAWLRLLGASMALAGAAGCNPKLTEGILPYVDPPRDVTPGIRRFYATSMDLDGYATGLLVESHEGRPTKIEGNPGHPASLGATGVLEQASILGLYDPDRARALRAADGPATFPAFVDRFGGERPDRGAGLRFLLRPTSSPLVEDLIGRVLARHPAARFTFHSPVAGGAALDGAELAFGARLLPQRDLRGARAVVSLDADFLSSMPMSLRHARHFAEGRRPSSPRSQMSRLYVVEAALSPTGSAADHRIIRRPGEIPWVALRLAAAIARGPFGAGMPGGVRAALAPFAEAGPDAALIGAVARDLERNAGAGLVLAGDAQPPIVHALAHLLNAALRNEAIAWTTRPVLADAGAAAQDLPALVQEMRAGAVDTLVVIDANPSYTAPPDLEFSRALRAVSRSVRVGLHEDETAADCRWMIPLTHYLEAWGDARAYDGTLTMVQPLIEPLFGGRTAAEVLAVFAGERSAPARRLLREAWDRRQAGGEDAFQDALRRGLVPGTAAPREAPALAPAALAAAISAHPPAPPSLDGAFEASFAPDPRVHDGRFANNAWLQELPAPLTKLTWDNAALIAPAAARRLGLDNEDVVELDLGGKRLEAPVLLAPGHAEDAITLHLGYGRRGAESIAAGVGFNAYALLPAGGPASAPGLRLKKIEDRRHPLAVTQWHRSTEGRPIALSATLDHYRTHPDFTEAQRGPVRSLLALPAAGGDQWAMTIDTSICTGCSACVVACQAENNTLVVGKEEILNNRQMHWLRIDTYEDGRPEAPAVVHEPMLCQHCEMAPCEYVCPVNATV